MQTHQYGHILLLNKCFEFSPLQFGEIDVGGKRNREELIKESAEQLFCYGHNLIMTSIAKLTFGDFPKVDCDEVKQVQHQKK